MSQIRIFWPFAAKRVIMGRLEAWTCLSEAADIDEECGIVVSLCNILGLRTRPLFTVQFCRFYILITIIVCIYLGVFTEIRAKSDQTVSKT